MIDRRGIVIHPHELDDNWIRRIRDMKLNVLGLHPVGGTNADESLAGLIEMRGKLAPLIEKVRAAGVQVEYEMHALSYLMPKSLFREHPDWFCMNGEGVRTPESFNICAGSEEGLAELSRSAEKLARLLPSEDHLYYFWLDDVTNGSCHCPVCEKLTPSDQQLVLVNAILRGIRKADPQGCVCYLAYYDTLKTPQTVKPEEGVFLEYAPIRRRLDRAINDETCPENVRESASLKELLAFFGTKNAKVLDYWTDNSLMSHWKYPPKPFALNGEVMRRDAAYYRSLGFDSITAFGCYLGKDYEELYGEPELGEYGAVLLET